MRPIVQEEYTQIFVIVFRCRTVDQYATKDTLPSLQTEMRMAMMMSVYDVECSGRMDLLPTRTVLSGSPCISDARAWCCRALSDGNHAIILIGVVLANTMEMNTCAVFTCTKIVSHLGQ